MEVALIRLNCVAMATQKRSGGESKTPPSERLKGWHEIAKFLGEPTSGSSA